MRYARRLRGGVTMFMLLVAMPLALMGLSLAGEWSSLLLVRRQATLVAESAAMAAASAVLPDGETYDLLLAQQRVDELMDRVREEVPSLSGNVAMLPSYRGQSPTAIVTEAGPQLQVTVRFATPPLPVVDFIRSLSGAESSQLSGQVSRSAGVCDPDTAPNGCRYPIPG